jgi:hypothetical protein
VNRNQPVAPRVSAFILASVTSSDIALAKSARDGKRVKADAKPQLANRQNLQDLATNSEKPQTDAKRLRGLRASQPIPASLPSTSMSNGLLFQVLGYGYATLRFEARRAQLPLGQAPLPPVTIADLLRATLRHRPDRILVGEVRGPEAFDLLQALNTGHLGSLRTIHANSAEQALTRLSHCVLTASVGLPHRSTREAIALAIHLVVHIARRLFLNEPGAIVIGFPRKGKRLYRTLWVPESVFRRVLTRLSVS